MPSLQGLLQRWGFVKLRRYGLELTPDGRVRSTRPAVLDDGAGGRIVGWCDGDVAIWKFSSWRGEPVAPAAAALPTPAPVPAAVMPVDVAAEPTVDEDDWEWTIALARARVAVDDTEAALSPPPVARAAERPTPSRTAELIGAIDPDDDSRVPTRPAVPIASPPSPPPALAMPRATTPSTVIPVPALPTTMAAGLSRMEPVVRSQVPAASASRFAKGTGPVDPPVTSRPAATLVEDTIPNLSIGDRTTPGVAPAPPPRAADAVKPLEPPVGDRTKPGIALPRAARAVELPSIKRRMLPR